MPKTKIDKDAELMLLTATHTVAVAAERLLAGKESFARVSSDCARNASHDIAKAIQNLQTFHELLAHLYEGQPRRRSVKKETP